MPALVLGLPIFDTVVAIFRKAGEASVDRYGGQGSSASQDHEGRIRPEKRAVMILCCISGIMGIVAVLYSRGLTVEYLGLTAVAIMLIYVLLSDYGKHETSA